MIGEDFFVKNNRWSWNRILKDKMLVRYIPQCLVSIPVSLTKSMTHLKQTTNL